MPFNTHAGSPDLFPVSRLPTTTTMATKTTPQELSSDWDIPKDITRLARKTAESIRAFAIKNGLTATGGTRIFYSPREWQDRGERYGLTSLLIICYEGTEIKRAFSHDAEDYRMIERLSKQLIKLDVFTEECTATYSSLHLA